MGFISFLIDSLTDFAKQIVYLFIGIILLLGGVKLLISGSFSYFFVGLIVMLIGAAMIGYSKRGLTHGRSYIQNMRFGNRYDRFDDRMDIAEWEMEKSERQMRRAEWEMDRSERQMERAERRMEIDDREWERPYRKKDRYDKF